MLCVKNIDNYDIFEKKGAATLAIFKIANVAATSFLFVYFNFPDRMSSVIPL